MGLKIPPGSRVALDTPVLIYFLERHPRVYGEVRQIFEHMERGAIHGVLSSLPLTELLVPAFRAGQGDKARHLLALVSGFPNLDKREALAWLSKKSWRHAITGAPARFGASTIERWYYSALNAKHDPVGALRPRLRQDTGKPRRLSEALRQALQIPSQAHPGWSYKLHYDNLAVGVAEDTTQSPLPSYATVRRYMKIQGLLKQRRTRAQHTPGREAAEGRLQRLEVRSFEAVYVHALWHLDFHHGSRKLLTRTVRWVTPLLLGVLDDRSRLACHVQWYLEETAECLVHGLCQAFQKRALPRALMSDNGSAMMAEELREGLHTLSILHETTLAYSPYQNAKQEVFWASVEGRLMAMLEGVQELTLELLNEATQAWVEREYHHTLHSELCCTPLERYLAGPDVGVKASAARA